MFFTTDEFLIYVTHVYNKDLDHVRSTLAVLNCPMGSQSGFMRDLASLSEFHHQCHRSNGRDNLWTDFMLSIHHATHGTGEKVMLST